MVLLIQEVEVYRSEIINAFTGYALTSKAMQYSSFATSGCNAGQK